MKPHGRFKLTNRPQGGGPPPLDPLVGTGFGRCQRIIDSLRVQILSGGPEQCLRIRRIFSSPREIYRVEIREPELHYNRTTLLDADALEDLLESEEIRDRVVLQQEL